jgi:murein DD-endopeptidase MepM/ murein hydrolase activator NlpD
VDGTAWRPLDGACWYPVDLLTEPGPLDLERVRNGRHESAKVEVGPYPYPVQRLQVAPEMTNPPPAEGDRIRRERQQVRAVWYLGSEPVFELPLSPPLDPLPEARSFGARRVFNGEPRSPHAGIDLSGSVGTPVRAAAAGTVVIAADHYFAGNSVFIDHGDDLVTMYFHLDQILVDEGDRVGTDTVIGTVGATGRVTGPHLHFGVRWHGARIDPTILLGPSPGKISVASP